MKVTYKECVVIDGNKYTVFSLDYGDLIAKQIRDGVIENDAQGIIDIVVDEVMNRHNLQ